MAYTKAQRRISEARWKAIRALCRADKRPGALLNYDAMTRQRVFVQARFPTWNEAVKELLACLCFTRDECSYHTGHWKKSCRKQAAKWRERFEARRREFIASGMLEILDPVEREIVERAFLSKP